MASLPVFAYKRILDAANDIILVTEAGTIDAPGPKIVYANRAFYELTGYSVDEIIGKTPRILQGPDTDREALDRIRSALEQEQPARVELKNYTRDGEAYWLDVSIIPVTDDNGCVIYYAAIQRNITEQKNMLDELNQLSYADPLTGLANRRAYDLHLRRSFSAARRDGDELSILYIDIDHFKQLNDTYGHEAGDRFLKMLAKCMRTQVRMTDMIARIGGEEFSIILEHCSKTEAIDIAEKIRCSANKQAIIVGDDTVQVTISIGVSSLDTHTTSAMALMAQADAGLYAAKQAGRNRVAVDADGTNTLPAQS